MISSQKNKLIITCVDPETCPDPFVHPGYSGIMHKKFVNKANEILRARNQSFDVSDSTYRHFYGTMIRYFSRQSEFFDSKLILNDKPSLNKGLLVVGDHGIGKSFMFQVLHELTPFTRQFANGFSFISANEVVEMFNIHGTAGIQNFFRGQRYFDDVGTEDVGNHFGKTEVFKVLIERRHELFLRSGKKTFITSNLSIDQFANIYGSRIESRLHEMFNIIFAGGDDRRKK